MKQGEGKDQARVMYVEEQGTFDEIARRLHRSDKTIREWADEGNWRKARTDFLTDRTTTHEKLHKLLQNLADKALVDSNSETLPSMQRIGQINKLAKTLKDLYSYENKIREVAEKDKPRDQAGLSVESLEKIEQQIGML